MESADLISPAFWDDSAPAAAGGGEIAQIRDIQGHVLFETSGSSGIPKWVALSKSALLASAAAVNRHLAVTRGDCWGLALPLRHVGGFGVAARAFEAGCGFVDFNRRWDAGTFCRWLNEKRVTLTSLVPTQVHDLVTAGLQAPACLRAVVVGGGRLDENVGRAARALGWPILASYGMTEAGSQIATQRLEDLHSAYQPAPIPLLPIWRARLAVDGRLCIAGPALFSGYLMKDVSEWSFLRRNGEWHQTDDRVALSDGMLTPLGRADSRVKVLGELVDPEEIERHLTAQSGDRLPPGSFVVIAVPHNRTGNSLVPVFDASIDPDTVNETLQKHSASAQGPWRLKEPVYLQDFPRSPLGKPRRADIAAIILTKFPPGI